MIDIPTGHSRFIAYAKDFKDFVNLSFPRNFVTQPNVGGHTIDIPTGHSKGVANAKALQNFDQNLFGAILPHIPM